MPGARPERSSRGLAATTASSRGLRPELERTPQRRLGGAGARQFDSARAGERLGGAQLEQGDDGIVLGRDEPAVRLVRRPTHPRIRSLACTPPATAARRRAGGRAWRRGRPTRRWRSGSGYSANRYDEAGGAQPPPGGGRREAIAAAADDITAIEHLRIPTRRGTEPRRSREPLRRRSREPCLAHPHGVAYVATSNGTSAMSERLRQRARDDSTEGGFRAAARMQSARRADRQLWASDLHLDAMRSGIRVAGLRLNAQLIEGVDVGGVAIQRAVSAADGVNEHPPGHDAMSPRPVVKSRPLKTVAHSSDPRRRRLA